MLVRPEPVLSSETPEPPIKLKARALGSYESIINQLTAEKLIGDADLVCVARYSRMLNEYEELVEFIEENGWSFTQKTIRGEFTLKRPEMVRLAQLEEKLYKLEKELVRTPYARLSAKIPPKKTAGEKETAKARLLRAK